MLLCLLDSCRQSWHSAISFRTSQASQPDYLSCSSIKSLCKSRCTQETLEYAAQTIVKCIAELISMRTKGSSGHFSFSLLVKLAALKESSTITLASKIQYYRITISSTTAKRGQNIPLVQNKEVYVVKM